jgi:hypothetical protein
MRLCVDQYASHCRFFSRKQVLSDGEVVQYEGAEHIINSVESSPYDAAALSCRLSEKQEIITIDIHGCHLGHDGDKYALTAGARRYVVAEGARGLSAAGGGVSATASSLWVAASRGAVVESRLFARSQTVSVRVMK